MNHSMYKLEVVQQTNEELHGINHLVEFLLEQFAHEIERLYQKRLSTGRFNGRFDKFR